MYFKRLGLVFRWLDKTNFQFSRELRNKDFVKNNMVFKEEISASMHKHWFENLVLGKDYYFYIEKEGKKIGIINVKDINNGCGELGIFLGDNVYLNSEIPILAALTLQEFAVEIIRLNTPYTKVLAIRSEVENFNISLGFKKYSEIENYFIYQLNTKTYLDDGKIPRLAAKKLFPNESDWHFDFHWEDHDDIRLKGFFNLND